METIITKENQTVTVRLIGRLDTPASQEVAQKLEPLKDDASGTIILDCKQLEYISSSGLRIFLTLRKAAAEKGGKVIVSGISNEIRSVFMMTGFLNLFEIQGSRCPSSRSICCPRISSCCVPSWFSPRCW